MNHAALKRFSQNTRKKLIAQISTRLDYVLHHDDPYIRAHAQEKKKIESLLKQKGEEQFLEETAYIWFNRLTALRFMDNRGYNRVGVVSPAPGESQPRILAEIKQGRLPREISPAADEIMNYINGTVQTPDPDREAYKTGLLAWCNYRGKAMPYLFTRIDDWAALLLPRDLLSEDSVITDIQKNILPEDCKDVEIIGWLYQYYISEKKDAVFAGLKKNNKITAENIPAATQLFTPEWIVRYMVENSLGRLWLNNNPGSGLKDHMKYYVEGDREKDFLKIEDPEEIKLIDPSCGSGHILVYAFDILYRIYEEEGFSPHEIASLIIQHNLYGVDIDDRAAALASFALAMKAREKDRTFLDKDVLPHVIASQNVDVNPEELGISLSKDLEESFIFLKQAKNLGSLIPVKKESIEEIKTLRKQLSTSHNDDLYQSYNREDVLTGLTQLKYLSPRYHCVVTNPPYMGSKGMNAELGSFVKKHYPNSKSDLFAVFMEKSLELSITRGYMGMINQQSWMFLSSYEKLRNKLIQNSTILSMAHLGPRGFDSISGEVVQTTSFVIKDSHEEINGVFHRLIEGKNEAEKEAIYHNNEYRFTAKASDFSKIPGSPIAYWVSENAIKNCYSYKLLNNISDAKSGMSSCNSDRFLRKWYEVSNDLIKRDSKSINDIDQYTKKWFPYNKGGGGKRWFGYNDTVINWSDNGAELKTFVENNPKDPKTKHWSRRLFNLEYFFKIGVTWSAITSSKFSSRYIPAGIIPGTGSKTVYGLKTQNLSILAFFNSSVVSYYLRLFSPTLNFEAGDVGKLPIIDIESSHWNKIIKLISFSKADWDLRETSWDFIRSPLLTNYSAEPKETIIDENLTDISWPTGTFTSLESSYNSFTSFWLEQFKALLSNEEELNRIFIDLYKLQDELTADVPYDEITILQNELDPKALKNNELVFKKDEIITQFISYAVGCIFGCYSLDKDGLILANAGEGLEDYLKQIPEPRFAPDASGILPITDEDDFSDDLSNQFKSFLKVSFSEEFYSQNLQFVEEALGKDIRTFFVKNFYNDHIKRYKKRPIYWMISSPSGSFKTLIYLHRYTRDTISIFLNDYLRPYRNKLGAKIGLLERTVVSGDTSAAEKTRAQKKLDKYKKVVTELEEWERDVVHPLAVKRVELDLDDGVKVNYGKLGSVLETVKGLNG